MVLTLGGLSFPALARAQAYEPARLLSLGGAQRALGFGNDAIFVNPAGMIASPTYEFEVGYADDLRGADRRINISVADGQAGQVAGGLAVTYGRFRPREFSGGQRRLEGLRFDIATAVPVRNGFSLGGVARYTDYRLLDGDEEIENGGSSGFSFDSGFQWQVGGGLTLGGVIQNIGAAEVPDLPRSWGAGLGFRSGIFLAEADIYHAWETQDPIYSGALGVTLAKRLGLRGAVTYIQGSDDIAVSFGAGLKVDRITLDAGYRQIISPTRSGADADERLLAATFRVRAF